MDAELHADHRGRDVLDAQGAARVDWAAQKLRAALVAARRDPGRQRLVQRLATGQRIGRDQPLRDLARQRQRGGTREGGKAGVEAVEVGLNRARRQVGTERAELRGAEEHVADRVLVARAQGTRGRGLDAHDQVDDERLELIHVADRELLDGADAQPGMQRLRGSRKALKLSRSEPVRARAERVRRVSAEKRSRSAHVVLRDSQRSRQRDEADLLIVAFGVRHDLNGQWCEEERLAHGGLQSVEFCDRRLVDEQVRALAEHGREGDRGDALLAQALEELARLGAERDGVADAQDEMPDRWRLDDGPGDKAHDRDELERRHAGQRPERPSWRGGQRLSARTEDEASDDSNSADLADAATRSGAGADERQND